MRRARKTAPSAFTYRPPFEATTNGSTVLDSLGFAVCQFKAGERILADEAARVIADALNEHFNSSSPHL